METESKTRFFSSSEEFLILEKLLAVSRLATDSGIESHIEYFFNTLTASLKLVLLGTAGPEPIIPRSFPRTSDITSCITSAGYASSASFPPLIADSCFLTVLISEIFAPHLSNRLLTFCLSDKEIPSAGRHIRLDAPPESRKKIRSLAPALLAIRLIILALRIESISGIG